MNKSLIRVMKPLKYSGRSHEPGEQLSVDKATAAALVHNGQAEYIEHVVPRHQKVVDHAAQRLQAIAQVDEQLAQIQAKVDHMTRVKLERERARQHVADEKARLAALHEEASSKREVVNTINDIAEPLPVEDDGAPEYTYEELQLVLQDGRARTLGAFCRKYDITPLGDGRFIKSNMLAALKAIEAEMKPDEE